MMSKILARWIFKHRPTRDPNFLIGPQDDPYLERWYIIPRNKIFNIYMHRMLHDDDDRAPHDHPWWSLSLCLQGYIQEHQLRDKAYWISQEQDQAWNINHIYFGQWKWRGLHYTHKLKLPTGEAWTLFMTGPKVRVWGFHCRKGFVPWHVFTQPDKPGQMGAGCGELD